MAHLGAISLADMHLSLLRCIAHRCRHERRNWRQLSGKSENIWSL